MLTLHICIDFFHKQQHQYFVSILISTHDIQDIPLWGQGIQEIIHIFPSIYSYTSLFCMSYAYFSEYAIV